jgi:hypothetical protein
MERLWLPKVNAYLDRARLAAAAATKAHDKKTAGGSKEEQAAFLRTVSSKHHTLDQAKKPSLLMSILRVHYEGFLVTGFFKALRDACVLTAPLILG